MISYKSCGASTADGTTYSDTWTEAYTTDPCTSVTLTQPAILTAFAAAEPGAATSAGSNPGDVPDTEYAKLTWTPATAASGTRTFDFYYCDATSAACGFTCDTLGCFEDADKCIPGGQDGPRDRSHRRDHLTVTMPDFLATHTYRFGGRQIHTSGACKKTSPVKTADDSCN